jgi:hypothetical protein
MRTKKDKIFDNKFDEIEQGSGPINFEIHSSYDSEKDIDDSLHDSMLFSLIEEVLINSKFKQFTEYKNIDTPEVPISKSTINEIYSFVTTSIKDYTKIEMFSMLSDYLDVAPSKFYNSLNNKAKDELIVELDKKINVLERRGIKKLF